MSNVSKHILKNGLTVLLKEVHSAPLISWWVLYRVGSRNEPTGLTGASHWVEHMLFKGTDRFPAGTLDRRIDREGGMWNAQTYLDYTAYFETMPADRIELALEIEADRMTSVRFRPEDVESERTVIISERQGAENSPVWWLTEEVQAAAFRVHGYHHKIIGDLSDLQTMTRDDLYRHYRTHYVPSNAIAVAVGDFDSDLMLKAIERHYGAIPAGEPPTLFVRPEPEQNGERRVVVERPGRTAFLEVAYHVPPARTDDWFRLTLLNSILSGPEGLGGGGVDNRTSRLYRALVETDLAASVDGNLSETIDPFLYNFLITVRDGRSLEEVEKAFDVQIDRVRSGDITQAELDRVRKQARALFAYGVERVTNQAEWLAFAENFDSYLWFERYLERLQAVTLDDVRTVAERYLRPQNRTVGWLVPLVDQASDEDEVWDDED